MGLDVYVGPLTRYYAGDWETVVQQAGREAGVEVEILRPGGSARDPELQAAIDSVAEELGVQDEHEEPLTDPAEIQEVVLAWRSAISGALGEPLEWRESADAPYFTDKPDWDGYGSLQVLAAAVERGERKLPRRAVADSTKEKRWRKAAEAERARFAHVYHPELWLPVDLDYTFEATDAAGNRVMMGSSLRLLAALREINDETFHGTNAEIAQWRFDGAEPGGPFEASAKFGLAVFLELAAKSVEEQLPMRLDY